MMDAEDKGDEEYRPALADRPYSLYEYNAALLGLIREVQDAILATNPILGQMRGRKTVHAGSFRNVPGDEPVDHPLFTAEAPIQVNMIELSEGNVNSFLLALYDFCKNFQDEMERRMYGVMLDVTRAVGNVSNVKAEALSADDVIRAEEMISGGFDEDGNPNQLQFMCGPEAAQQLNRMEWSPEQRQRHADVRARKREEYLASKRSRRLHQSSLRARA